MFFNASLGQLATPGGWRGKDGLWKFLLDQGPEKVKMKADTDGTSKTEAGVMTVYVSVSILLFFF